MSGTAQLDLQSVPQVQGRDPSSSDCFERGNLVRCRCEETKDVGGSEADDQCEWDSFGCPAETQSDDRNTDGRSRTDLTEGSDGSIKND